MKTVFFTLRLFTLCALILAPYTRLAHADASRNCAPLASECRCGETGTCNPDTHCPSCECDNGCECGEDCDCEGCSNCLTECTDGECTTHCDCHDCPAPAPAS